MVGMTVAGKCKGMDRVEFELNMEGPEKRLSWLGLSFPH